MFLQHSNKLFQFLLVQLKVCIPLQRHHAQIVSIPTGSIKSFSVYLVIEQVHQFQFLLVQLKVVFLNVTQTTSGVSIPTGSIKRVGSLHRICDNLVSIPTGSIKRHYTFLLDLRDEVSIPTGSIKRCRLLSRQLWPTQFQFLLVQLKVGEEADKIEEILRFNSYWFN